ncbi:MAG: hypothetical protein H7281_06590 [Bacteriovorax sp.]|nr:hypothetical protein [Bacteriovorax sp.]
MNTIHEAPQVVSMFEGQNKLIVNFFDSKLFQNFIGGQAATDATNSSEVLFSVGVKSP